MCAIETIWSSATRPCKRAGRQASQQPKAAFLTPFKGSDEAKTHCRCRWTLGEYLIDPRERDDTRHAGLPTVQPIGFLRTSCGGGGQASQHEAFHLVPDSSQVVPESDDLRSSGADSSDVDVRSRETFRVHESGLHRAVVLWSV